MKQKTTVIARLFLISQSKTVVESNVDKVAKKIIKRYLPAFKELAKR